MVHSLRQQRCWVNHLVVLESAVHNSTRLIRLFGQGVAAEIAFRCPSISYDLYPIVLSRPLRLFVQTFPSVRPCLWITQEMGAAVSVEYRQQEPRR